MESHLGFIKNKIVVLSIGSIVIIAAAIAGIYTYAKDRPSTIAAYVNEQPVTKQEFHLYMQDQIAAVAAYFYQQYGVGVDRNFWDKSFNGETPQELLKTKTMSKLISAKVMQQLAQQRHIVNDISYPAFLQQLEEENRRREKAVLAKEVIYGPTKYDEKQFLSYSLGRMDEKLQEIFENEMSQVSEETLLAQYESDKDKFYHLGYEIQTEQVFLESYTDKQAAVEMLRKIQEKVRNGESLQLAAEEGNQGRQHPVTYQHELLDSQNRSKEDVRSSKLEEIALHYEAGEMSSIIELDKSIGFIRIESKNDLGYRPYSEVKEGVVRLYSNEQYRSHLDKLEKEAKAVIVDEAYKDIVNGNLKKRK
ncbi:MAG: PpiC-type peptidyl-prolyl cis-trans isomerase [Paenibacillus sp.]|nr:PpiC-type peptidyl-prolyl cis-trans isomerase [Paenibacillus sp.]